jgi:hypothetical protein
VTPAEILRLLTAMVEATTWSRPDEWATADEVAFRLGIGKEPLAAQRVGSKLAALERRGIVESRATCGGHPPASGRPSVPDRLDQPLARAVPETRPDGTIVAPCRDGQLTAKALRHEAEVAIEVDDSRVWVTMDERQLRTGIATLTAALGQLIGDGA